MYGELYPLLSLSFSSFLKWPIYILFPFLFRQVPLITLEDIMKCNISMYTA